MARQTDQSYTATAINWVKQIAEYITSADKFYAEMRHTPHYVPRRIARIVWREYKHQESWMDYWISTDPDAPLLRGAWAEVDSISKSPYNVKVHQWTHGQDPDGATAEYAVYKFEHPPTMNDLKESIRAEEKYQPPRPGEEWPEFEIDMAYHTKGMQW